MSENPTPCQDVIEATRLANAGPRLRSGLVSLPAGWVLESVL
jgi:hypothetical protein